MTPEQLQSIRRTVTLAEEDLDRCARCFYADLFDRHPPAHRLFAVDVAAQRGTLLDELLSLAKAVHDPGELNARGRAMGLRHQREGLHAADYPFVGEALVAAMAVVVGERWTDHAEASWRRVYALIADVMLEGAEEGLFNPSD